MLDTALEDLGRAVYETLEHYLERNGEASDYGWGEDPFGQRGE